MANVAVVVVTQLALEGGFPRGLKPGLLGGGGGGGGGGEGGGRGGRALT